MDCMRDGFEQGKLLDGRFISVAPLNHGSFGMVFTAKDTFNGDTDVAIKCITKSSAVKHTTCPASIATDDQSEELAIHSRFPVHPNIVNLIHHFESGAHQYMVLELCGNGDLYEAIRAGRGPLETEHVRDLMLALVDVIDHLHSNGVFHRDVKPENIFLTADGTMKLGDFGLATTDTWSTEFQVGSDRYMAPEQFESSVYGYGYSPQAADVWAIGIVLLNVLFQRNPFTSPTLKDLIFSDFSRDRESLFDLFPNMSQDTFKVLTHSLALDPENRSLSGVRQALQAVKSFTTDEETLDDFCVEQNDLVATAAREPLRTPSITSPNMNGDSFPWSTALLNTPQKPQRQLSTIMDEDTELFPGSVRTDWQYADTDEVSLSSNVDSGLGMSYKSSKSSVSTKASSLLVGSLPISFTRPKKKSPYGAKASGFSKSWSDLYEEDLEMEQEGRDSSEFDDSMSVDRVETAKPSTPQLRTIEEDDRGSVTPRAIVAESDITSRSMSPLRKLVEHDKSNPELHKVLSATLLDRWTALGTQRALAKQESSSVAATPTPQKSEKSSSAFANFPFFGSKKQQTPTAPRDRTLSWRQGSPTRLRSTSTNKSQAWERRDHSPTHAAQPWKLDNNWRNHKTPSPPKQSPTLPAKATNKTEPRILDQDFLTTELDDTIEPEWVGGWHELHD